jgi:hypothetical protein
MIRPCRSSGSRSPAGVADGPGAGPGLLVIAAAVGPFAMSGVRVINQKSTLTPWLLLGLLPAVVGWYFHYVR